MKYTFIFILVIIKNKLLNIFIELVMRICVFIDSYSTIIHTIMFSNILIEKKYVYIIRKTWIKITFREKRNLHKFFIYLSYKMPLSNIFFRFLQRTKYGKIIYKFVEFGSIVMYIVTYNNVD